MSYFVLKGLRPSKISSVLFLRGSGPAKFLQFFLRGSGPAKFLQLFLRGSGPAKFLNVFLRGSGPKKTPSKRLLQI